MGGEFFLTYKPTAIINQEKWVQILREITADSEQGDVPKRDAEKYAFEYLDPVYQSKSFRVAWKWGPFAIDNKLGGRSRSDWSCVRNFCQRLCDNFPGQFALVVCDGFSGYDDAAMMYYDGLGTNYKEGNYEFWPWTDNCSSIVFNADEGCKLSSEASIQATKTIDVVTVSQEQEEGHSPSRPTLHMRLCSFCYKAPDKIFQCGKCHKRPYCSRCCQIKDWTQHKIWCGKVAELDVDFEVCETDGKGKGIFAKRPFTKGEKILVERPVIIVSDSNNFKAIKEQFDAQPPSVQYAIECLHHENPQTVFESTFLLRYGKGVQACKRNIFDLSPGSGLCITASRLNHSCLPNCSRYYVKDHGLMVISAGMPIARGDELTISYSDLCYATYKDGFERFQEHLLKAWNFRCSCRACLNHSVFNKLVQIKEMDDKILKLGSTGREKEAFKLGERMIRLYDQLCHEPSGYHRTYYDMFQMAVLQKNTLGKAKKCASKSLENLEFLIGGSNKEPEEITIARKFVTNPESHRNYLLHSK